MIIEALTSLLENHPRGCATGLKASWGQKEYGLSSCRNLLQSIRTWLSSVVSASSMGGLIALSVFLLSRPYQGITQDAYLYMGRALADLDPTGVGRDLMFVHDGQFTFSVYRLVTDALLRLCGLAAAAKILAVTAALAWFLAIQALARQFTRGPAIWMAVIFTSLLPSFYGLQSLFSFGELIAIPRPLAEALVLAALAALAAKRDGSCLCCLATAALFHPIMALAGIGVFLLVRGLENKRWFLFCALAFVLFVVLALLHMPLFDRVLIPYDPEFRDSDDWGNSALFPALWPRESFLPIIVQSVTIAIAAHLQQGRRRRILAAVVMTGLSGVAVTTVFGDWFRSLLVIQIQPWRMIWLMAAIGPMSLGLSSVELWQRSPSARMVLALLALSWSFSIELLPAGPAMAFFSFGSGQQFLVSAGAALAALALHIGERRYAPLFNTQYALWATAFCAGMAAIWNLRLALPAVDFTLAAPNGYGDPALVLIRVAIVIPLCFVAFYFVVTRTRISGSSLRSGAIILFALTIFFWDRRPPAQRMLENDQAPPEVMRLISQRPGEVLWIDGLAEAWFLLGRPQWVSPLQRGPAVFSPVLTSRWRSRIQLFMNLKLVNPSNIEPWRPHKASDELQLSQDGLRPFCSRDDAPSWIIAPLEQGQDRPVGIEMGIWPLPEPIFQVAKGEDSFIWRKIDRYGVIPCAGQAQSLTHPRFLPHKMA